MNYLLTGATGFVGSKLVETLLREGDSVNYLGRKRSKALDSRAAFHHWDGLSLPPLETIAKVEAVVNLAGEPISQRWSKDVKQRIYESRVEGTRQLVQAMGSLRDKPSVLVSASAVGYYGERGDEVLTEESRVGLGFLADVCSDWEKEALRAREFGVRVVLIRIAVVLGKNGGALKQMLIPCRLGLGGKFGNGQQWMPWIHLEDLTGLLRFAAQNASVEGALNASAPNPITNAEFTHAMAKAVHRPAIMPVPKFALDALLGELAGFVVGSQRLVPARTQASGFQFQHSDIGTTLKELV